MAKSVVLPRCWKLARSAIWSKSLSWIWGAPLALYSCGVAALTYCVSHSAQHKYGKRQWSRNPLTDFDETWHCGGISATWVVWAHHGVSFILFLLIIGLAPRYLSDHIQLVADSNRRRLRSSSSMQLAIRRTRLSTVGDCAFPVAGCRLWNSLPSDVTSAPTLTVFRNRLKTRLFSRSFPA